MEKKYRQKFRFSNFCVNNKLVLWGRHFCEIRAILHYPSVESHSENGALLDSRGTLQQTGDKGSGV